MSPETYYRIVFLMLARDSIANGGKEILINSAAQYGGYIAATAISSRSSHRIRRRLLVLSTPG